MAQFLSSNQLANSNGVKALVYGDSGIGKTMLTATLPAPLLISAESGLLSLKKKNIERVYGVGTPGIAYEIPVWPVASVEDLTKAYEWCAKSQDARQFYSIAIDSISEIGEVVLNNAKRQVKDPRQAYGEMIEKMETTIRAFRDLPGKNVYMSAKMDLQKDEMSGMIKYMPSMPGTKLGPKLPYFFDEVFYIGVNKDSQGNKFRYLQTQPDIQRVAKDRSGALNELEYPNLTTIFMKILGE